MAIFGYFNVVHSNEERWGVNVFGGASGDLVDVVDNLELHDLPLVGLKYTFFERGPGGAQSRLDRFCVQDT